MAENYQISLEVVVNKKVANIKNSIKGEIEKISILVDPFLDLHGYSYAQKITGEAPSGEAALTLSDFNIIPWNQPYDMHTNLPQGKNKYKDENTLIPVEANTIYVFSGVFPLTGGSIEYTLTPEEGEATTVVEEILDSNAAIVFNIEEDATLLIRCIVEEGETVTNLLFEEGSVSTEYEPYTDIISVDKTDININVSKTSDIAKGENYPISIINTGANVYGFIISINEEHQVEAAITRGEVDFDTATITIEDGCFVIEADNVKPAINTYGKSRTLLCNLYLIMPLLTLSDELKDNYITVTLDGKIVLKDTSIETIEDLRAAGIQIVYELDNAIIYQLNTMPMYLSEGENYITVNIGKILTLTYPAIDYDAQEAAEIFTYEVLMWTLLDSFVTILKWNNFNTRGLIQSPSVTLSDDGTRNFSFSIPKFYYDHGTKIFNPLWHLLEEVPLEANMHKLKVIFNKGTIDEAVEEFLVNSVTYSHLQDNIMIDVTAEGLAFNELGKIGYKINLSADNFYLATEEWFKSGMPGDAPKNNIQYWNDLVFKDTNSNWKSDWRYEVRMNWSSFSLANLRRSDIVYEDEYISSWNVDEDFMFWPNDVESFKEKLRLVEAKESNIYNITLDIAKIFGVYCKYEYEHDDQYHIVGRKVVYYNNYLLETAQDDENGGSAHLDLTYPYSSSSIKRVIDNTNVITKMFVRTVDSNATDSNIISIMNVDANKSKEDYLLNFDYLHLINTISDELYEEVNKYEARMHELNNQLISVESRLEVLLNELIDATAKETFYTNAILLDQERYDNAIGLRNALTGGLNYILITEAKPASLMLHTDTTGDNGYYVTLKYEGLDMASIRLYTKIDYTRPIGQGRLTGLNTTGIYESDEFGNITGITNITFSGSNAQIPTVLYMTGLYSPWLYYDKVAKVWLARKAQDLEALKTTSLYVNWLRWYIYGARADYARVDAAKAGGERLAIVATSDEVFVGRCRTVDENHIDTTFEELDDMTPELIWTQKILLEEKLKEIAKFEKMMGPALREGYWSPEDYLDYGDNYLDRFTINNNTIEPQTKKTLSFTWDSDKAYDTEEGVLFLSSADGSKEQYIIVDLTNHLDQIKLYVGSDLSFIYYDKTAMKLIREMILKEIAQLNKDDYDAYMKLTDEEREQLIAENKQVELLGDDYEQWADNFTNVIEARIKELKKTNLIRSFTLGSLCEFGFVRNKNDDDKMHYTPVLIITGTKLLTHEQIDFICNSDDPEYQPFIGIYKTIVENRSVDVKITPIIENLSFIGEAGVTIIPAERAIRENYDIYRVYPRIFIKSLKLKKDSSNLMINLNNTALTDFEDYYVLADERKDSNYLPIPGYYITLKPDKIFKLGSSDIIVDISYSLSNADTSIYLDALKIMKENAYPKVSYEVELCALDKRLIRTGYNKLNRIVHINDLDLLLLDVCGYISSITIPLDKIFETTAEIKNYETKFEDLFSTIVALTEAMLKNEGAFNTALGAFAPTGEIVEDLLQDSIMKADLNYSFNLGKLTIDSENGIRGLSEAGIVAMRGGGIFTATTKDSNGNWKWNTGILPSGINANLITTGLLDTNKIRIYAGDQILFQFNGDGLFAYKSFYSDYVISGTLAEAMLNNLNKTLDPCLYVVFNENGLFLTAKKGAWMLNEAKTNYVTLDEDVDRVEISWDGLILRNNSNLDVFFADIDGNLTLRGTIESASGTIGGWTIGESLLSSNYINLISKGDNAGIFLTGSLNNLLKTLEYNGTTYVLCKRIDVSGDDTDYYLPTANAPTLLEPEKTVSSCYMFKSQHAFVEPRWTYVEYKNVKDTSNNVSGTGADNSDGSVNNKVEVTVYIVASENSKIPIEYNGVKIVYDGNTSLNAKWYDEQLSHVANYQNYVKYIDESVLQEETFSPSIRLLLDSFKPTFSVFAKTGEVQLNNGSLGSFSFNTNQLVGNDYAMTIRKTVLAEDNKIGSHLLDKYKNCFCEFIPHSADGTFTLTRVSGSSINFNIASTLYFLNKVSEAGRIAESYMSVTGQKDNTQVHCYARTGTNSVFSAYKKVGYLYTDGVSAGKKALIEAGYVDWNNVSLRPQQKAWGFVNGQLRCYFEALPGQDTSRRKTGYADHIYPNIVSTYTYGTTITKNGYKSITCSSADGMKTVKFTVDVTALSCFGKGTMITLDDNTECPIERLNVGLKVKSYDENSKTFKSSEIKGITLHKNVKDTVKIYLSSGKIITATKSHPLLTTHGWAALDVEKALAEHSTEDKITEISLLLINDKVISDEGIVYITNIIEDYTTDGITVYNIDVEPYDTYLAENIIVHNKATI